MDVEGPLCRDATKTQDSVGISKNVSMPEPDLDCGKKERGGGESGTGYVQRVERKKKEREHILGT